MTSSRCTGSVATSSARRDLYYTMILNLRHRIGQVRPLLQAVANGRRPPCGPIFV
jgi:hypothetical protein